MKKYNFTVYLRAFHLNSCFNPAYIIFIQKPHKIRWIAFDQSKLNFVAHFSNFYVRFCKTLLE